MSGIRRVLRSPVFTGAAFVLAAALLLTGGIGSTRAALTYFSEDYRAEVELHSIGATLIENGEEVSWNNYGSTDSEESEAAEGVLFAGMLSDAEDEMIKLGKAYPETVQIRNSGSIDENVRVIITKAWVDADGNKLQALTPGLIELNLVNQDVWTEDETERTAERTVLYYQNVLESGETTPAFCDAVMISGELATAVRQLTEDGVTEYTYAYDGMNFQLSVEVNVVQSHNGEAAMLSAWGHTMAG